MWLPWGVPVFLCNISISPGLPFFLSSYLLTCSFLPLCLLSPIFGLGGGSTGVHSQHRASLRSKSTQRNKKALSEGVTHTHTHTHTQTHTHTYTHTHTHTHKHTHTHTQDLQSTH